MSEMTNEQLAAIRGRANNATPGPWRVGGMDSGHSKFETNWWVTAGEGDTICDMDGLSRSNNEAVALDDGFADAEFIATAREDVPALLAEVDRLRAKLDLPCGSCHPCTEWAAETWRRAGGKLPHKDMVDEAFAERDQLRAIVERIKAAAFTQERDEWHAVELLDEIRTALEAPNV